VQVTTVGVAEARAKLSELLDRVRCGEEIVIARYGKPVAKIVVVPEDKVDRSGFLGCMKGQIWIADDFDAPLTEEELREWYDRPIQPAI
jgi:prevent-host-death family protein